MQKHVKILGILNIVWGSMGVIAAIVLIAIFGGVMGVLGVFVHEPEASRIAIPLIGLVGGFIILIVLITSAPSVITGIGLLRMDGWSRILGIIVSALHLFSIPFGTALGIYGLWVLCSSETEALFRSEHLSGIAGSRAGVS